MVVIYFLGMFVSFDYYMALVASLKALPSLPSLGAHNILFVDSFKKSDASLMDFVTSWHLVVGVQ